MKKSLLVFKTKLILASNIIVQGLLLLMFSISLCAQNSNAAQWQSAGGEKILSGSHSFLDTWTFNSNQSEKGFWKGGFYDPEKTRNYQPWDNVVKNSVAPIKGTFTVQGPGHIGLYQKSKGGSSIVMYNADTKEAFRPWYGTGNNFDPEEFWGKVPEKAVITIVVEAQMTAYDNRNMTGQLSYVAPQEVEYEVWFFPQDGGKIIKIDKPVAKFDKPKPGILYYKDKVCN
ncbi:hypothetical protein Lupro_09660 [Lutibacter profundi]|uniref:Uncharacterized protein n=1 Tax=Lutibacter profundi TaxID=1622118 RepID=A0A109RNY1_9FLAO|nr:hypothetical protein [Lutibacter profundi]AMC11516.1 hypothetical protein Lupro_09660 [Lutibacter profundi]